MTDSMHVFDRKLVRQHRERAAPGFSGADFLIGESAARLADRLLDVSRVFPLALDLGCHAGGLGKVLEASPKIGALFQADFSPAMARAARARNDRPAICADEEFLPFGPRCLDLVLSNLSLHWVNDLPGALSQIRMALKPDGLLLAAMFGAETLKELRGVLIDAEIEIAGGTAPRVSPFTDVRDAGNLLTRAGFSLPVVDAETITVTYSDMFKLMADLRAMGETNTVLERRRVPTRRDVFLRAAALYSERFSDGRGRISASFQIITMTAWAPHASQQKPLRPGSATTRLADALQSKEIPLPDAVPLRPGKP